MSVNVFGPILSFAMFLTGIWIGWRAARVSDGEIPIPTQGFGRGAPKELRVAAVGFAGAAAAFLLRLLSEQVSSLALAYVAVAIGTASIGIGWGAGIRGWREWVRSSRGTS